jgi:hypothetical protein
MPREFEIKGGYIMWIYFKDHGAPHVHVKGHGKETKIEIQSLLVVRNKGFAEHELNALRKFIVEHQDYLLRRYDEVQKK